MPRRINVAVLGSYSANDKEKLLAAELGELLAEMNLNVISGDQKGVMLSLCERCFSR